MLYFEWVYFEVIKRIYYLLRFVSKRELKVESGRLT